MDITVCMGLYNSAQDLPEVLAALKDQGEFVFRCFDNGSTDDSKKIVLAQFPDAIIKDFPFIERMENIRELRRMSARDTDTEFIMLLDSDEVIPDKDLQALKDYFVAQKDCGACAIPIAQAQSHVQMGVTMMRAEVAKKLVLDSSMNCECLEAAAELAKMGLSMINHPTLIAKHLGNKGEVMTAIEKPLPAPTINVTATGVDVTRYQPITESLDLKALLNKELDLKRQLAEVQTFIMQVKVEAQKTKLPPSPGPVKLG